jgi:hypothetical protein
MRAFAAAALTLFSLALQAQENDIFDPADFIDPRARGAVFREGRFGLEEKGQAFSLVRVYGGRVSDYQWRNADTQADLKFAHVTSSYYTGARQLNLKFTSFRADERSDIPAWRGTVQFGRYFLSDRLSLSDNEDARISGRVLLTWSIEDNPFRDENDLRRDGHNHEFGVQGDLRLPLPKVLPADSIDGSIIWMRRRIDADNYVDRATYLYRFRQRKRSNGRLRLNATLGIGAERNNGWHCCVSRAVLSATFFVPRLQTGINIAFAPTYTPATDGRRRTHSEFAVYLDRTAFSRLADVIGAN